MGYKEINDDFHYSTNLWERNGDATATLHWIQKTGDLTQLKTMTEARDLSLGYVTDGNIHGHDLTHDTSNTMRAIIEAAENDELPDLQGKSIAELQTIGEKFARDTLPSYKQFKALDIEQDHIRIALGQEDKLDVESRAAVQNDDTLTLEGKKLAGRIHAAHDKHIGGDNPLDTNIRYANTTAIHATWRITEQLGSYGGHNLQEQGPLGSNVEIGEKGTLCKNFTACLNADQRTSNSLTPPEVDPKQKIKTPQAEITQRL